MGVADYIRLGLGVTSLLTGVPPDASNGTAVATDFGAFSACVSSWASYASFTSTDITPVNITTTSTSTLRTRLTYGTADVYTTYDGVPVANGNFTPTKIISTTIIVVSTSVNYDAATTYHPAQVSATPTCALQPACSALYVSYMSSLGLSHNASVPATTPAPANSPSCPTYYYKPFSTCSYWTDPVNTCTVAGKNVQVFYFPPSTTNATGGRVVYSYAPNITFTSPSVYLSFDWLSAVSSKGAQESGCSSCGFNGCSASAVGGGDAYSIPGTKVGGALITLNPEEVSTFLVSFNPAVATSIASVIANGGPQYANAQAKIASRRDFWTYMAQPLDLHKLTQPAPTDYYLNPSGAPGCKDNYPQPKCSTIFEAEYRPILSLPPHVSALQPAWSTCIPAIFGVYDPPVALTEASEVDLPTISGYTRATLTQSHVSSPPTALAESLPVSTAPRPTKGPLPTDPGGGLASTSKGDSNGMLASIVVSAAHAQSSHLLSITDSPINGEGGVGNSLLPSPVSVATFVAGGQTYTALCYSSNAIVGTNTLAVGGSVATIDGHVISAAFQGIVFNSKTATWVATTDSASKSGSHISGSSYGASTTSLAVVWKASRALLVVMITGYGLILI